ncbi:ADR048Wp [Eremothecium gossypii ATCC 10895]|uniref:ADR048Wp n=1 Tax=Eremothecium gossypii (strain ATCC 10895 / CBS 109.51 / FGSC 9923 / NRRL Y-1056) TaxID=284811 RepID=Q75A70_EREGS|nr:ADR048Wp [Eremothecium gossypii ATCC 10895]AAS51968.1 ADR048Wp [Eremothecium gossypii ATCC 10895]AEY96268.1 FADR048Wp [Eremothecium gossypii FDAG1]
MQPGFGEPALRHHCRRSALAVTMYKNTRKRLMPKSAVLVRRYERQIKTVFVAFLAALMIMFLAREPYLGIGSGTRSDAKLQPAAAERLQGVRVLEDAGEPVRAAFVVLAREEDLWSLVTSIRHVEDRFNARYHYDWVFVGATPLSEKFQTVTRSLVSGRARFCVAQAAAREYPPAVEKERAGKATTALAESGVSIEQVLLWRFHAGYLALLPEMQEYEYYWYVEPDIELYCDINYDIFRFMKAHRKQFGFILATEDPSDYSALWTEATAFAKQRADLLAHDNLRNFVSNDGDTFNGCVFRAGFQVSSLDFWRSDAFRAFFEALDASGGFFYNLWTDVAVQTLAVALLMDRRDVHFFDSIGLYHREMRSCPFEQTIRRQNKCICNPEQDLTWETGYVCTRRFMQARGLQLPKGIRRAARAV